ncbi:oligosaccharide flippase family protein [Halalkalirubrum salinum]|uniref:oligosaccharide flippase family protein n=1 Tax=Halalkalirubrum salinum TaxID=2563889 RepID=UPI0010FAE066
MVSFLSSMVMSVSGFIATIVLTRTLGQNQYGIYVVVLSVLSWVAIAGKLGIPEAIRKRISEVNEGNYVIAGALAQLCIYIVLVLFLWLSRPYLNKFMGIQATWILILMLLAHLFIEFIRVVLDGQHLVHVSSILVPVEWTSRSIVQVALVLTGFGITGAFVGYIAGAVVAVAIGFYFIDIPNNVPSRKEFTRLRSYAQFSWLSSVKGRTFLSMDTIVLAVFVSNSLIAVYEIAWNLASLFSTFGGSISQTLFPEMSEKASEGDSEAEIAGLLRVSLAFSGLFVIPGLIGGAIVGDIVLTIYGPGFDSGYYILLILTFARLLYGYMSQFVSTINALNHPELTFYINIIFVLINTVLNIGLTWQYGWYGAAVATTVSAGLGLFLGYHYARKITKVIIPISEIAKQFTAGGIMAGIVLSGRILLGDSLLRVIGLVCLGAIVYFITLLILSREFRTTVQENLPFRVPVFSSP